MATATPVGTVKQYLNVFKGRFTEKRKEATTETVERINAKGDKVHELRFKSLQGWINKIFVTSGDFGNHINIDLIDKNGTSRIQLPVGSGYARNLILRLQNVDFKEMVDIRPAEIENADANDETKVYINEYMNIYQNNVLVKECTETKKALPKPVKGKDGRKTTWSFVDLNNKVIELAEELGEQKIKPIFAEINLIAGAKD